MTENMLIEWTQAQSCGDCGADAAFLLHAGIGAAICRECSHEHPMNLWTLDESEAYNWVPKGSGSVAQVLHVTCYTPLGWSLRSSVAV